MIATHCPQELRDLLDSKRDAKESVAESLHSKRSTLIAYRKGSQRPLAFPHNKWLSRKLTEVGIGTIEATGQSLSVVSSFEAKFGLIKQAHNHKRLHSLVLAVK